jgi:hypothetical protein
MSVRPAGYTRATKAGIEIYINKVKLYYSKTLW